MKPIRVIVVDDSALMRKLIPQILSSDPDIEVVATALDGNFALKKIAELRPDVITLDVDMPSMDGIETLRVIVEKYGIPTVMVSSMMTANAELTFKALEIGAFDFVAKPQNAISVRIGEIGAELIEKVKTAANSPVTKLSLKAKPTDALKPAYALPRKRTVSIFGESAERILAIGISTGGPNALTYLLPRIPADFPAAIVIVQHMPVGFTGVFAARLDSISSIEVKEARDGDIVSPGRALIAPGDRHLKVKSMPLGTIAVLSDSTRVQGHKPSADVLFRSVAEEFGSRAMGLIMTGMGADGSSAIGEIKRRGGRTVAQDEQSCVVYGMPKQAVLEGNIDEIVSLEDLGGYIEAHFMQKEVTKNERAIG